MKSKAKILENCLNENGLSFNNQLKPDNIPLRIVNKSKRAIYNAMDEYVTETRSEMMEFAEWFKFNDTFIPCITDDVRKWFVPNHTVTTLQPEYTLDELFSYWLTNIKGK